MIETKWVASISGDRFPLSVIEHVLLYIIIGCSAVAPADDDVKTITFQFRGSEHVAPAFVLHAINGSQASRAV